MPFSDLIGHDAAVRQLKDALRHGTAHHAYLFTGPDGVGKEKCARLFAQALNCERGVSDARSEPGAGEVPHLISDARSEPGAGEVPHLISDARSEPGGRSRTALLAGGGGEVPHLISDCCGACEACVATARGAHPDVFVLMPEIEAIARKLVAKADLEASPSRDLRIGQVRELQARVELKASHGRRKVALVLVADALNEQAQNALLKTLEEPPPNTCIVLVTSAPDQLLPTVRSRCLRVNFGPLPLAEVASRVAAARGLDADTARLYAALAAGSLGRALAIDPKDVERRRASVLAEQAADAAPDDRARLDLAEALAERDLAAAALNAWESFYRDAAVLASGAPEPQLANPDFEAMARACAMRHGLSELLRRLAAFPAIRDALVHNGNVKLQLEALLLGFGGIR